MYLLCTEPDARKNARPVLWVGRSREGPAYPTVDIDTCQGKKDISFVDRSSRMS